MSNIEKLKNKLGDLTKWIYVKSDSEGGECTCGKKGIVYRYHIANGQDTAIVGSECINAFEGLPLHMQLSSEDKKLKTMIKYKRYSDQIKGLLVEAKKVGAKLDYDRYEQLAEETHITPESQIKRVIQVIRIETYNAGAKK